MYGRISSILQVGRFDRFRRLTRSTTVFRPQKRKSPRCLLCDLEQEKLIKKLFVYNMVIGNFNIGSIFITDLCLTFILPFTAYKAWFTSLSPLTLFESELFRFHLYEPK